eukprot:PITA_01204
MNYDVLLLSGGLSYADENQPPCDSFGRLVEPLASSRPWMVTHGNHEIEKIPLLISTPFKAYRAHILIMGSYTNFGTDSDQYKWLQGDLSHVNRWQNPWLIALIHAPWYNRNTTHQGGDDSMKESMEQVLHDEKVDIVFAGHVHAYEHFTKVFDNQANPCGFVHITIGYRGNREGLASK